MGSIQESIAVAAPLDRVWDTVLDFEARPRWSPRVKEARLLDAGPLQVGSRIRLVVDRDRFTPTVVELRPRERLALLTKGPGFRALHTYTLQGSTEGTTLTMTGELSGPLGSLAMLLMKGSVQRDLTDELDAIKRASEAAR